MYVDHGELYEMVTGNLFGKNQLMIVSVSDKEMEQNLGRQRHRVFHERQEEAVLHKSFRESYAGKVGRVAADELRNIKDLAIAVISVSCRSAIEGGVLPEIAFSVSDAYIRQVDVICFSISFGILRQRTGSQRSDGGLDHGGVPYL